MSREISYISLVLEVFGLDLLLIVIFSYTTERCSRDYACGVLLFWFSFIKISEHKLYGGWGWGGISPFFASFQFNWRLFNLIPYSKFTFCTRTSSYFLSWLMGGIFAVSKIVAYSTIDFFPIYKDIFVKVLQLTQWYLHPFVCPCTYLQAN